MVKKIITHVPPRHFDDTIAVALLLSKYKDAKVEFLHPQDDKEKIKKYKEDPHVILVDIGEDYNKNLKNYDHHQDQELPSSLLLVLINEFPEYVEAIKMDDILNKEITYFDLKDRYGFKVAQEETKLSNSLLQESIILKLGESLDGLKTLSKALKSFFDEKLKILNDLSKVETLNYKNFKIAIDEIGLPPSLVFKKFDADIIISRNSFNKEDTSIIKNTSKESAELINLDKLKDKAKFIHKAKFMAVIPENIENVKNSLKNYLDLIIEKKVDNKPKM
jgi:hypothetical protein